MGAISDNIRQMKVILSLNRLFHNAATRHSETQLGRKSRGIVLRTFLKHKFIHDLEFAQQLYCCKANQHH